jgi:putative ATP-binding cassette transporter
MTAADGKATHVPPAGAAQTFDNNIWRQGRLLAVAIHHTPGTRRLYLLVAALVVVILATAGAQIVLNAWNAPFYQAIENRDLSGFLHQLLVFFEIAAVLLVLNVAQTGLNQGIRLKLRELATLDLIGEWMTEKRESRITRAGEIGVNPDQRIAQDAAHLTELTTDLGIGLLQSSLLLVSFIGVLWGLSRSVVFHLDDTSFTIPGYMVWAALLYAATGSFFSWRVARPLVRLSATRYAREADLRISLVRGNEQADGIALGGGEAEVRGHIEGALGDLLSVMRQIVFATVRLTSITAGYGWVAIVVPIIVAAPAYFSGSLTFGELMMVVGAFNQVQGSLRWFVDNSGAIADWRATLLRVTNFRQALLHLDEFEQGVERITRGPEPSGNLAFNELVVMNFNVRSTLSEPHLVVKPGEHVLCVGGSGSGKSTFFLSVAGLWNWGTGEILLPPAESMLFLPQHPFLPQGTLRDVITFSSHDAKASDGDLNAIMTRVGIDHLAGSLDREAAWDKQLNREELERIVLARLILDKPAWVVSDEAIDLTDADTRELVASIFGKELAGSTFFNIAGHDSRDPFYSHIVQLRPLGAGDAAAALPAPERKAS